MRMTMIAAALIALPGLAQNPGTATYVRATYTKWLPDHAGEGRKFLTEVAASVIKGLGKQTEAFDAAFPKGDYNTYIRRYRELTHLMKTAVYRVDSAIWK